MTSRKATLFAVPLSLLLAGIALWWSPLNQDEGWYLMAAQRFSQGQLPYLDYAFTQPPVFPVVYSLITPLVGLAGVAGARLFTLALAASGLAILIHTIRKEAPAYAVPLGTLLVILLLGLNPGYLQFSVTVKTYALAGVFLTGAAAFRLHGQQRPSFLPFFLSGVLFALAAGTRLSLLVFPLPVLIDLFRQRRILATSAAGWCLLGFSSTLLLLFGPFLILAPEGLLFGLFEFHTGRTAEGGLLLRAAFLARWLRGILPVAVLFMFLWPKRKRFSPSSTALIAGSLLVTLVHLFAPFPYDEYQTVLLPVLVLVAALEMPYAFPGNLRRKGPAWLLLFMLLFAGTSPQMESWFAGKRDRLWWPAKSRSDLSGLREAAAAVQNFDPEGTLLFTPDTYLAIEAGRDVPPGFEMGPFSYFPEVSTERAERLNVLNDELVMERIHSTPAGAAALSGYAFAIQSPMLTETPAGKQARFEEALRSRFEFTEEIKAFGQASTTLRLYRR